MSRVRIATLAASLLLAAAAPAAAAPHAGDVAPAFTLPKTAGGNLALSALHGKAVYLNFFASWCGPCNEEASSVGALAKRYAPRGLHIVGINEQEDKSKAAAFARQYKWPFVVAIDGDGSMGKDYGVVGLPVHIFIDKSGKISTYRLGEMEPDEIESAIKKIL
jgi:peroxiredoxin